MLLATLGLCLVAAGLGENAERLRAMPRERRQQLAAQLDAWQRLPVDERQAVRSLDAQLAALPTAERDRLVRLMRRYHLWLQSLPAAKRQQIEQAPLDQRIALVHQLRAEPRPGRATPRLLSPEMLQVSALSPLALDPSVRDLKFWFSLDTDTRTQLLRAPNPGRQENQFRKLAQESEAYQALRQADEARVEQELHELRQDLVRRRAEPPKAALKGEPLRKAAELRRLRGFAPEPVSLRNLGRFEAAMPPWIRQSLDLLPPDAAERRLQVLYRLTFPAPAELPEPVPPKRGPGGSPTGRPRTPNDAGKVF